MVKLGILVCDAAESRVTAFSRQSACENQWRNFNFFPAVKGAPWPFAPTALRGL